MKIKDCTWEGLGVCSRLWAAGSALGRGVPGDELVVPEPRGAVLEGRVAWSHGSAPGDGGQELGWPLQPCNVHCPGPKVWGFGTVWGHWPLLGEGTHAGTALQQSCSLQAISNVLLLLVPSPLLSRLVTACKNPALKPNKTGKHLINLHL